MATTSEERKQKFFGAYKEARTTLPNLVEPQVESFKWLLETGLAEVFKEFSSVKDYSGKKFELDFTGFKLQDPKFDEFYAKQNKLSFEASLKVTVRLKNKTIGSVKEQELFMADFPLMTKHGTFIISGIERVIVPQLARSFGIFFTADEVKGHTLFGAKIIPARGAWIEIETDADGAIYVRIDRKRKFAVTSLLRILGAKDEKHITGLFEGNPAGETHLKATFAKDHAKTLDEAFIEIHKRLRDGEIGSVENAKEFINSIFDGERYDLSRVGRFRFNKRFAKGMSEKELDRRTLSLDDVS
jgi:DNA-directed RNA polymerase subunit beta